MKYFTRLRVRRVYKWRGDPLAFNRKLKTCDYGSLAISVEGLPRTTVIVVGQHILIEGEDEDDPYVAKVTRLFGDDSGKQKKAVVQWFARVSEVPASKLKLLGREPHPQEIFYYQGRVCEDEVNAESILRPVKVKHLDGAAPFPDSDDKDTLFVKMSWDSKIFRVAPAAEPAPAFSPPPRSKPSLPPSPPCSPPAATPATPASRRVSRRTLSTPEPAEVRCSWGSMSTGKVRSLEAESHHSATKLSASKCLSATRRKASARTPGVRKKLQLCSPEKSSPEDAMDQLLDQELESEMMLVQRLSSSPPQALHLTPHRMGHTAPASPLSHRLTPLRKAQGGRDAEDAIPIKRSSVVLQQLSETDSPPPAPREDSTSPQQGFVMEAELLTSSIKTPRRRTATPRRNCGTRGQKAATPSRRKEAKAARETALAVLVEVDNENSPMLPAATTPRSSKRKSALLVSSRIRKQLHLLNSDQLLNSDGEDEDEDVFVPSKALQSSSEEEEEEEEELDSDQEVGAKKSRRTVGSRTPRSKGKRGTSARTPRKTPNKKITPSTPQTPRYATPIIPSRSLPARCPANVLEEARARLHVSSVPESLPCREQEFQDIYSFVESKIVDGTGGCMYISGVPGTGKTATVHEVMRCLQHAAEVDEIPPFHFIEINGMKMTDPHQAYVQILQKLTSQKATADHAAALLEKRFSNPAPRKESTVLLVDELDLLWTRKQNVMYNLFDWPTRRHARLVVLTIANTMDLPERIMINRVASRLGLTRMSFQPYSFKQLQQIITSRLNKVKAFEEDALQLISRKVAALSGDARRCLDICRRATEICEHSAPPTPPASGLVGMSHVMEALNEMFSSSYITAIKCASLQEQLFLRAVIAEFRRLGLEEATFQQVFVQHQALCRVEGLQPISVSEGLAVCQRLGACRLLLLEPSRLGVLQRVRLNVSQDDVLYALKAD
ncbi:origin recognition complex subunit 1 isoform X1 [Solea solea]|uniref:origin recognition complex subunit 1 isoform X1 n=1 Tax=Solea solea TaxID=90069 RepID=UPI00272A555B|nr:origin recognition complex subunit 1 isoform X1 [Solea solea]